MSNALTTLQPTRSTSRHTTPCSSVFLSDAADQVGDAGEATVAPSIVVSRCGHCRRIVHEVIIPEDVNFRSLYEHALGCPSTIAAVHPALPIFRTPDQLLSHFVIANQNEY